MTVLSQEAVIRDLEAFRRLLTRAEAVCALLGYSDRAAIHFDESYTLDPETTFYATWEDYWAYGGHETMFKSVPIRYLWTADEDILREQAELRAKEEKRKEEASILEKEKRLRQQVAAGEQAQRELAALKER